MPADRDSQLAGLRALVRAARRDELDESGLAAPDLLPYPAELDNDWSWPPREPSLGLQSEAPFGQQELEALENTAQFRAALSSFGPRKASKLSSRLSRWKPQYWPLVTAFLIILVMVGWFATPYSGPLGWPLTILWTWPIISTLVGIRGIWRTRRILRRSEARWAGNGPAICEDFLVVVVPTIGRHDIYPALERSVLSYIAYLPACFPELRIDLIIEQGCEATARISKLAARSPLVRIVTVPKRYRTPNGTRFKARANHYAHELRIRDREVGHNVWVLHMDDDTGVGPDTAVAMARFIEEQVEAGPAAKHMAQGILTYPRQYSVNRLTWLADSSAAGRRRGAVRGHDRKRDASRRTARGIASDQGFDRSRDRLGLRP